MLHAFLYFFLLIIGGEEQVIKAGTKKPHIPLDTYMQDQDNPNQCGYAAW